MPNCVESTLRISGRDHQKCLYFIESPEKFSFLDFNKIIPMPSDISTEESSAYPEWYRWRLQHWGCKGNAIDSDLIKSGKTFSIIGFWTPNAPAIPVIKKLSQLFPKLVFTYKVSDPLIDMKDHLTFLSGRIYRNEKDVTRSVMKNEKNLKWKR
jgi:hypothetical protein